MVKKSKNDKKYKKANIPKAVREQCWIATMGQNIKQNVMLVGVKMKLTYLIYDHDLKI